MSAGPRHTRIPLFARVETPGLGPLYAYNISQGGLYVKAPGLAAEDLPLGKGVTLRFALPDGGPKVTVGAEVVWVDPALREHLGQQALGVGVRFAGVEAAVGERIRSLVDSFRYQVVAHGPEEALGFVTEALGDLLGVEPVSTLEGLKARARSGQAGLLLLVEAPGADEALRTLAALVRAPGDRRPPVLYCAHQVTPGLEALLEEHPQVQFARLPLERLELRSQVRCAVDAHVASFQTELLSDELARSLERLRRENAWLREHLEAPAQVEGMVGQSPAMQRVFELIERVAPLTSTVMVLGETGTGKELVARAIVAGSERREKPFIVQNCAAFSEALLENELFGHVRGAYTGADRDRAGLFEAADGGTIFLDEIGEMPASMQAKLLRVLENGEVRRLGDTRVRQVDVRIICATHRDLEALAREGKFRPDLLYRLKTLVISVPPLRERREDIPLLARHFLERLQRRHGRPAGGLDPAAAALLQGRDWPGNARELAHAMERLFVLADQAAIDAALVREVLVLQPPEVRGDRTLKEVLEAQERQLIEQELEKAGGVIARAARALGMERSTLSRRVKELGLTH